MIFCLIDHNTNPLEFLIVKQNAIEPISNKELMLENNTNLSRNFNHTTFGDKESDSSSVFQQISEETLNIETTSENPIVQRQSSEESKESILPSMCIND